MTAEEAWQITADKSNSLEQVFHDIKIAAFQGQTQISSVRINPVQVKMLNELGYSTSSNSQRLYYINWGR